MMPTVQMRPATPDDEPFLLKLYTAGRRDELEAIGWNEAQITAFGRMQFTAQRQHHGLVYPQASDHILVIDEDLVGRMKVAETDEEILLVDIALMPEYQRKGIGTLLLENLKTAAIKAAKPLRLHVLADSAARRLYTRLGFADLQSDGLYVAMEFVPETVFKTSSSRA